MATLNKNNRHYNNNNNNNDNNEIKAVKLLDDDMKNTQTTIQQTAPPPLGVVQAAVTRSIAPAEGGNQVSSEQGHTEHTVSGKKDTHGENQQPFQRHSLRLSNKFIIISGEYTANPEAERKTAPFRQTVSSSALSGLAGTYSSLKRRPVSLISTSSTSKLLPRLNANPNDVSITSDVSWPSSKDINEPTAMSTDVTYHTLDQSQSNLLHVNKKTTRSIIIPHIKKSSENNTKNNYKIRQSANFPTTETETVKMSTDSDKTIKELQPQSKELTTEQDMNAAKSLLQPNDPLSNQVYSDATSVRSLASFGIGSTDGRRLVIKRVPTTPIELFSLVHPDTLGAKLYAFNDKLTSIKRKLILRNKK